MMSGVLGRLADLLRQRADCRSYDGGIGSADIAAVRIFGMPRLPPLYNSIAPAGKPPRKNTGCAPHPKSIYLGDPLEIKRSAPETAHFLLLVRTVFRRVFRLQWLRLSNKAQMSRRRGPKALPKNAGQANA